MANLKHVWCLDKINSATSATTPKDADVPQTSFGLQRSKSIDCFKSKAKRVNLLTQRIITTKKTPNEDSSVVINKQTNVNASSSSPCHHTNTAASNCDISEVCSSSQSDAPLVSGGRLLKLVDLNSSCISESKTSDTNAVYWSAIKRNIEAMDIELKYEACAPKLMNETDPAKIMTSPETSSQPSEFAIVGLSSECSSQSVGVGIGEYRQKLGQEEYSNFRKLNMKKKCFTRSAIAKFNSNTHRRKWKYSKRKVARQENFAADMQQTFSSTDSIQAAQGTEQEMSDVMGHDMESVESSVTPLNPRLTFDEAPELLEPMAVKCALECFKIKQLRKGQLQPIVNIFKRRSTLLSAPTGSGKSLCFCVAAQLFHKRYPLSVCVVISPLTALIHDQVRRLPNSVKAIVIDGQSSMQHRNALLESASCEGVSLVFCSPEVAVSTRLFSDNPRNPKISFVCIDEAHCYQSWSHFFRPAYFKLPHILTERGIDNVLLLSATCSSQTIDRLRQTFKVEHVERVCETALDVAATKHVHLSVSVTANREKTLMKLFSTAPLNESRAVLVYCQRRNTADAIASLLQTVLINDTPREDLKTAKSAACLVEAYHAGLSSQQRCAVQNNFLKGRTRVVCATVAFGLGIDNPQIDAVVHYGLPSSVEAYVQEVGRCGRRMQQSHCHMLLATRADDLTEQTRHVYANSCDVPVIKALLQPILIRKRNCQSCSGDSTKTIRLVGLCLDELATKLDVLPEVVSTIAAYLEDEGLLKVLESNSNLRATVVCDNVDVLRENQNALVQYLLRIHESKTNTKSQPKSIDKTVEIEVDLIDLLNAMPNCDSIGRVRDFLFKQAMMTGVTGKMKRRQMAVNFHSPGLVVRPSTCCVDDDAFDAALRHVVELMFGNERRALGAIVECRNLFMRHARRLLPHCFVSNTSSDNLKADINTVFDQTEPNQPAEVIDHSASPDAADSQCSEVENLRQTVAQLVEAFGEDVKLSARAVARILHGIESPNFPAPVWGRTRFWRAALAVDFPTVLTAARSVLLGQTVTDK